MDNIEPDNMKTLELLTEKACAEDKKQEIDYIIEILKLIVDLRTN